MLVPATKLHPYTHHTKALWALRMHNFTHTIPQSSVSCSASTSSSDEPHSRIAMSKADLESCQWLKPSKKGISAKQSSAYSSIPLSSSYECCFAAPGSSAQGSSGSSSQVSNRSVARSALSEPSGQSSSNGQPSSGSLHSSPSKHSSILINALSSTGHIKAALSAPWTERAENGIERAIFDFRFLSLLAVAGSLAGSFLCFLKGCVFIVESYAAFYAMCFRGEHTGKMVLRLVEAVDVYLTGTVMLIFGMGLYGLFISNVATNLPPHQDRALQNSSLFGMFLLQERPKWMRIASLDELKTKLGHVVVMILLVKMFERSKAVTIATGADLLSYSISIFLTSAALLVLRHLHH